ncbi:MAG: hypothetical protein IPG06_19830 [Haliea sp.]|nr:hypothetical protein [Haliea sp.]
MMRRAKEQPTSWWRTVDKMRSSNNDKTPTYVIWLGRAGLLPFMGLPVVMFLDAQQMASLLLAAMQL